MADWADEEAHRLADELPMDYRRKRAVRERALSDIATALRTAERRGFELAALEVWREHRDDRALETSERIRTLAQEKPDAE